MRTSATAPVVVDSDHRRRPAGTPAGRFCMSGNHSLEEVACMSGAPHMTARRRRVVLYTVLIIGGFTAGLIWPFVVIPA